MSSQVSQPMPTAEVSDREFAEYLRTNPDFFERHPELLALLRLPHESGGTVSLVERQITLLRDQANQYKAKLDEIMRVARENEEVNNRMHRLTLTLIESATFDEVLNTLQDELHDQFDADAVELRLFSTTDLPELPEESSQAHSEIAAFRKFFESGKPVCGQLNSEQLTYLFGPQAEEVRSAVLIPLKARDLLGLLAVGSRSEQRFHAGMGTHFLGRLGEIVARTLQVVSVPGA
jgi:uncharacterized protein YigA (DUF484 family)